MSDPAAPETQRALQQEKPVQVNDTSLANMADGGVCNTMTRMTPASSLGQEKFFRLAATCRAEEGLSLLAG